jgi:hypothetical protein
VQPHNIPYNKSGHRILASFAQIPEQFHPTQQFLLDPKTHFQKNLSPSQDINGEQGN